MLLIHLFLSYAHYEFETIQLISMISNPYSGLKFFTPSDIDFELIDV